MNIVQKAYTELMEFNQAFEGIDLTNPEDVNQYFKSAKSKKRDLWLAVFELTKDANPRLKEDIDRGSYDNELCSSEIHFLDLNWQVLQTGDICPHCNRTHNHGKTYPQGA